MKPMTQNAIESDMMDGDIQTKANARPEITELPDQSLPCQHT